MVIVLTLALLINSVALTNCGATLASSKLVCLAQSSELGKAWNCVQRAHPWERKQAEVAKMVTTSM